MEEFEGIRFRCTKRNDKYIVHPYDLHHVVMGKFRDLEAANKLAKALDVAYLWGAKEALIEVEVQRDIGAYVKEQRKNIDEVFAEIQFFPLVEVLNQSNPLLFKSENFVLRFDGDEVSIYFSSGELITCFSWLSPSAVLEFGEAGWLLGMLDASYLLEELGTNISKDHALILFEKAKEISEKTKQFKIPDEDSPKKPILRLVRNPKT